MGAFGWAVDHGWDWQQILDHYDGNTVMGDVRTEDYLRGVVPREVAASWGDAGARAGMNALRAQAVAARSYALSQNRHSYAKTCDTTSGQTYRGAATRPSATGSVAGLEHPNTDQAIVDTVGKVRRWLPNSPRPAGTIASTEFSSSNGPRTAGYPFPARDDAGDGTARNLDHRWTRVLDPATLAARYGLGTLLSISMADGDTRYDGIWYNTVVMVGTARSTPLLVDAWKFRNDNGLPSPGFTLVEQPTPTTTTTTTLAPTTTTTTLAPTTTTTLAPTTTTTLAPTTTTTTLAPTTTKTTTTTTLAPTTTTTLAPTTTTTTTTTLAPTTTTLAPTTTTTTTTTLAPTTTTLAPTTTLPPSGPTTVASSWQTIGLSVRNSAVVRTAQQTIINAGIYLRGGADGWFGEYTATALRTYQSRMSLPVTGVIDEATAIRMGLYTRPATTTTTAQG